MRILITLATFLFLGCSSSTTSQPADLGAVDGLLNEAGPGQEMGAGDGGSGDAASGDAATGDAGSGDATQPMANRNTGEITSGGQLSTGGTLVLRSQVGHAFMTDSLTGGTYALRWNASVIPW